MRNFFKIKINGKSFPAPLFTMRNRTMVSTRDNANGVTISQRIGRDRADIESLVWGFLPAEIWAGILSEFSGYFAVVTYPDMESNMWVSRKMFPSDRTAEPFNVDRETGLPASYINCRVNLNDVGCEVEIYIEGEEND